MFELLTLFIVCSLRNLGSSLKMSIALLPQEYLPFSDQKAAARTCRSMYSSHLADCVSRSRRAAVSDRRSSPRRSRRLITVTLTADDVASAFDALQCANRLGIRRIRFVSASLHREQLRSHWNDFWCNLGPGITELSFHDCDISELTFSEILLKLCPNLRSLTLDDCNSLFMSGKLLNTAENRECCPTVLSSIVELNLTNNRYLSDALFNRLTSLAPNITSMSLAGCQLSFHSAVYNRFYPSSAAASESVFTFQNVVQFLERQGSKMTRLNFSDTLIDDRAMRQICEIRGLQLDELQLFNCRQISAAAIETMCSFQPKIRILVLARCSRITDRTVLTVSQKLTRLTHLDVSMCRGVTADGIADLAKSIDLISVDLSGCESLHSSGIQNSLCSDPGLNLVRLNLTHCDVTEETVIALARRLSTSLRHLDLSNCRSGVTDVAMHAICRHLRWLRCLKLAWCTAITDATLTGRLSNNLERTSITRLSDIRGLRKLDLCACVEVTDSAFYEISLTELMWLDLSLCAKLTDVGLAFIGNSCNGSLEKLVLSQCRSVTDIGVVALVKCLPRLKYLDLQGCKKIGHPTLDAIKHWCPELQYLDVTACPLVTSESIEMLECALPRIHVNKRFVIPDNLRSSRDFGFLDHMV